MKGWIFENPFGQQCTKSGAIMVFKGFKRGKFAGYKFCGYSTFPKCRNVDDF